jgi:hypothetical protein
LRRCAAASISYRDLTEAARAGQSKETDMATSYETPTFDPRGAFSWTLRGGEIALLERR